MKDLINISEENLKKINEDLNDINNFPLRDNLIIPEDLYNEYKIGKAKNIDMLLGSNKDEVRYFIN